jgi:hypothetical protein
MIHFIKGLLKSVLPVVFLKKTFLIYNTFKIKAFDRLLLPERIVSKDEFLLYREGFPFIENNVKTNSISERSVEEYMQQWNKWTQEEYILIFKEKHIIEPRTGWAIVGRNKLLYFSIGISRTLFLAKPSFLALFFKRKKITKVNSLISLRDTGEENYFHFFNDVLTKLYLLAENKIKISSYPLLVSKSLWDKPYFQFWLEQDHAFRNFNWVVQKEDEYIESNETVFCKALTHRPDLYTQIFSVYKLEQSVLKSKRIYLKRNPRRLRFVENVEAVESLVKKYDFEIVDTDELSAVEQVKLFSQAAFVIGIHGAGLTNLMFAQHPEKLIELFPPPDTGYLPFHYIMIASLKGMVYDALIGLRSGNKFSGGFLVNVIELEKLIKKVI